MKKILLFGGTSEGRKIAETLSRNKLTIHTSVATDYGRQVLKENNYLKILEGRMDSSVMKKLCQKEKYDLIIDATHPFAKEVSENIKSTSLETNIPLIRFERNIEKLESEGLIYADDATQCVDLLLKTTGKILLTTGTKDLKVFCKNPTLRERLMVRILPAMESLKLCYENNLEGKQIIAMQGPFSESMNENQIEEYGISVLVTKESGKAGGTDCKISASLKKGIKCIVIKNSSVGKTTEEISGNYTKCSFLSELYTQLENRLNIKISDSKKMTVDLIGIGMGNMKTMTVEAAEKIKNADCIFGAERMIQDIKTTAKKHPYYLSKDIIPMLQKSLQSSEPFENVCILFSGDSGFFSGAAKLHEELKEIKEININIIPGISSISYLSAKTGIPYQDAEIISLHGTEKEVWLTKFENALTDKKKIFILTSGLKDIHEVAKLILDYNRNASIKFKIAVGFMLSYENERIEILEPEKVLFLKEEGLYSAFIITE
ncbi:precorrin-6A reductase [Treponema sp.]|uniref:precorrin-6A reductase n=1 Tax=Treponema sp. TaxID=166 RepID=UPI00298DEB5C|nr:precorrin-6A reductase [Treponema sp.]MCQ2240063.1 precorrin-6A reductase [Treponema sp.]